MQSRRLYRRINYNGMVTITKYSTPSNEEITVANPIKLVVSDISIGGLGAMTSYNFQTNSEIHFTIKIKNKYLKAKTKIVWAHKINENIYDMGLQFIDLSIELKESLIDLLNGDIYEKEKQYK